MKKVICIIMCCMLFLFVAACGEEQPNNATVTTSDKPTGEEYIVVYTNEGGGNDLLTIEEIQIKPLTYEWLDNAKFFSWKMKVRNTSGQDLLMNEASMSVWYRYLDENQDVVESSHVSDGYSTTVEDGKALWIEEGGVPGTWDKATADSVAYIEIYAYNISLSATPEHEFEEPILIDVRDIKNK